MMTIADCRTPNIRERGVGLDPSVILISHSQIHIPSGKDTGTGRKRPKKVSFSAGSFGIPTLDSSTLAIVNA